MKCFKIFSFLFLFSIGYFLPSVSRADITTGLVGYWNFDEGAGSVAADSSGNGNNGTLQGATTWSQQGKINGAISLNGSSDYINIYNNPSLNMGMGDFTISAWINTSNNSSYQYIFYKFSPDKGYLFRVNYSTGYLALWVGDGTNTLQYKTGSIKVNDGQWHHVVARFTRGQKINFFVDGVIDQVEHNASSITLSLDNNGGSRIGGFAGNYFSGFIDEVRVYNRALSQQEITSLYTGNQIDDIKPVGSLKINNENSAKTSSNIITLNLSASDNVGVNAYYLSESSATPALSDSKWVSFSTTPNYSIDVNYSLTVNNGNKTIYAWYKDISGNISNAASISVFLDNEPPEIKMTFPTSNEVLSGGIIGHWKLDEASGTTASDSSMKGSNGTINGTVFAQGKRGGALSFNGVSDYVSIPKINSDEISISAWFYKNSNDTVNADTVFGGWQWSQDPQLQEGFDFGRFFQAKPDVLEFVLVTKDSSGIKTTKSTTAVFVNSTGAWHHIVGTYNKATGVQNLYVDGILASTTKHPIGNIVVPLTTLTDMRIGHSRVNNGYFNGLIDDVMVYDRELNYEEIKSLYDNSAPDYITVDNTADLKGEVSDISNVTNVNWVNDRGGSGEVNGNVSSWLFSSVNLSYGVNKITITAKDNLNNISNATVKIIKKSSLPNPAGWTWRGVNITTSSTPDDITYLIKELGVNSVFLRLHTRNDASKNKVSPEKSWSDGIAWMDKMLDKIRESGIVAHIGTDQFPTDPSLGITENDSGFWNDPYQLDKTIQLIGDFVNHFKERGAEVGSYSFLSEPTISIDGIGITPPQWVEFRKRIINKIREYDKNRWIEITPGPGGQSSGYKTMELLEDDKIIYNAHMFDPHVFTHQGIKDREQLGSIYPGLVLFNTVWDKNQLKKYFQYLKSFQDKYNVPVSIGSFGAVRWAPGGEQYLLDLADIFKEYNWSWSYWAYKSWHGWDPFYNSEFSSGTDWQQHYVGDSSSRWRTLKEMFKIGNVSNQSSASLASNPGNSGNSGGGSIPGTINPGVSVPNSGVATTIATSTITSTATTTASSATGNATTSSTSISDAQQTNPQIVQHSMSNIQPFFSKPLKLKSKDEDVKKLQEFLSKDKEIYPEGLVTGYYGPLTVKAVQRFQKKHNIVSAGSPETTGYGLAGPKTITKLNELLNSQSGQPTISDVGSSSSSSTYDVDELSQSKELLIIKLKQQIIELMLKVIELMGKKQAGV